MLRQRLLVAVIGLPVGVAAIVLGGYFLFGAAVLLTILGLHEYYSLVRAYKPNLLVGYGSGLWVVVCSFFFDRYAQTGLLSQEGILLGLLGMMLFLFGWAMVGKLGAHLLGRMALTAFGVIWVAVGFSYIMLVRSLEHGLTLAILLVASTVANDTFAYFVGRVIGRHPMAPRISPKKTIEGAVGGIAGSILAAFLVAVYSDWLPMWRAAVIGLIIGFVGQWGDLFESALKRDFGVKDSGKLLPGHGGILDRFDAFLFAGFATYWCSVGWLGDLVQ